MPRSARHLKLFQMSILNFLEADFFYQLLAVFRCHENGGAVRAGARVQRADAKLAAPIIALVLYFKRAHTYVGKEIAEDDQRLGAAVGVGFIRQANFDVIIYVARQFGGITAF